MDVIYILVFVVLCFFTIFPTSEIESVGLTIDQWCSHYITDGFIQYNIKVTSLKLLLHSVMPLCYIVFMWLMALVNPDEFAKAAELTGNARFAWEVFVSCSWALAVFAAIVVTYWSMDSWNHHPIARQLQSFTSPTFPDWRSVAANINDEYRRDTKMMIRSNAISTLVVTESWIVKTNLYGMNVAQQSETVMVAYKIDIQDVITDTFDSTQFVNIAVKPLQESKHFSIRVNGVHFRDFQDHVQRPIVLLPSVKFSSLIDRFVEVFKEQIKLNPTVPAPTVPIVDSCLACLQAQPDVQIAKHCLDVDEGGAVLPEAERCQPCNCRPLWCLNCLALWFASRQQRSERDTWLSKKASCPMCRARFCVLDVCSIETVPQNEE